MNLKDQLKGSIPEHMIPQKEIIALHDYPIPNSIVEAATILDNYFRKEGISEWALMGVCSRSFEAQIETLSAACKAACEAAVDCLPPSGEGELDALYYKSKLLAIDSAAAKCSAALSQTANWTARRLK